MSICNYPDLQHYLQAHCQSVDFNALVKDLEPFVFQVKDAQKILEFTSYISQLGPQHLGNHAEYLPYQGFDYDDKTQQFYHPHRQIRIAEPWLDRQSAPMINEIATQSHRRIMQYPSKLMRN